MIIELYC